MSDTRQVSDAANKDGLRETIRQLGQAVIDTETAMHGITHLISKTMLYLTNSARGNTQETTATISVSVTNTQMDTLTELLARAQDKNPNLSIDDFFNIVFLAGLKHLANMTAANLKHTQRQ